jgi:hypothetical protein
LSSSGCSSDSRYGTDASFRSARGETKARQRKKDRERERESGRTEVHGQRDAALCGLSRDHLLDLGEGGHVVRLEHRLALAAPPHMSETETETERQRQRERERAPYRSEHTSTVPSPLDWYT